MINQKPKSLIYLITPLKQVRDRDLDFYARFLKIEQKPLFISNIVTTYLQAQELVISTLQFRYTPSSKSPRKSHNP